MCPAAGAIGRAGAVTLGRKSHLGRIFVHLQQQKQALPFAFVKVEVGFS